MLLDSWSLEPWLEYSQVYLEPTPWAGQSEAGGVDDNVEVLDRAFKSGIAQGRYLTVFITPHRDVSPLPLLVELWDCQPVDDLADWPEAFEATVAAGVDGMLWSSPTMDGVFIPVVAGTYRALIVGRDFAHTDGDRAAALDNYRLQLWPCDVPVPPRRLSAWAYGPYGDR